MGGSPSAPRERCHLINMQNNSCKHTTEQLGNKRVGDNCQKVFRSGWYEVPFWQQNTEKAANELRRLSRGRLAALRRRQRNQIYPAL